MSRAEKFELGAFTLTSGLTLPDAQLSYTTHGTLNAAKTNAILFPNFLGGVPEALEVWIGEGRPLDPRKYFLVLPGHFGNGVSSSPSNTPAPFDRAAFPAVHIADDVLAQRRLLAEKFGIQELQLVLGWSLGAVQVYEWAVRFPRMVKRMASIAGAPRPSPWTRLWLHSVLELPITSDPAWNNGFYESSAVLAGAVRRQGRLAALTLPPPGFYAEGKETWRSLGFSSTEDFVTRFWEAFWLSKDPNDIIAQARKARAADPSRGGDMAAALRQITAKAFVAAFTGDAMFLPDDCRQDAARIPGAQFKEISSAFGHLATLALSERDRQSIDGFLAEVLAS